MSKKKKQKKGGLDLYKRKTTMNWIVVVAAILIGSVSIFYTRGLVQELRQREEMLINLFAKTLENTTNTPNTAEVSFGVTEILLPNNLIPVIWTDDEGNLMGFKNISIDASWDEKKRDEFLRKEINDMRVDNDPITITFRNEEGDIIDYQYVYYRNSNLLRRLEYYPYVQLSIIFIFGLFVFVAFSYSKTSEQNRVWVGLAKETAHQLGTPISSLIAWIEYMKSDEKFQGSEIVIELEKDIDRLNMITNRFSNIGSVPVLTHEDIPACINATVNYLRNRISKKVDFNIHARPFNLRARINKPLFDWVIENLCKNAVDSMGGIGKIDINIKKSLDDKVIIDISDTGKGIQKSRLREVFSPGYTTKKRGWGLGLTLVKRIIENYHEGKITVLSSEIDKGTTFRIFLKA